MPVKFHVEMFHTLISILYHRFCIAHNQEKYLLLEKLQYFLNVVRKLYLFLNPLIISKFWSHCVTAFSRLVLFVQIVEHHITKLSRHYLHCF